MFCPRFRGPLTRLACALAIGTGVVAQSTIQPTNSAPNPYQTIEGWAKMPAGRSWGSTSAVDIDPDGKSVWVGGALRLQQLPQSGNRPGEMNRAASGVLKFDESGKLVRSFDARACSSSRTASMWTAKATSG